MRPKWRAVGVLLLMTALSTHGYDPTKTSCAASLPVRLKSDLSREQQQLLAQILPQVMSDQPVVRCELRAPIHIPCQIKPFPHIKSFCDQKIDASIANFEVKPFAQPPHLVFFDDKHEVVETIPVASDWTSFQLRDTILSTMANT